MSYFLLGTQEGVRNSHGKRAISVWATDVLLYMYFSLLLINATKAETLVFSQCLYILKWAQLLLEFYETLKQFIPQ